MQEETEHKGENKSQRDAVFRILHASRIVVLLTSRSRAVCLVPRIMTTGKTENWGEAIYRPKKVQAGTEPRISMTVFQFVED